jgi:hypothetical protein
MNMKPRIRKVALAGHITFTIGWLGAIVAFMALAIAGLASNDVQLVRSCYIAMELIGWYVLVPLSVASLTSGVIMSVGTAWGLFRHYWVSIKFVITIVSLFILFIYTQTLEQLGELGRNVTLSIDELRNPSPVLHAGAAILALLVNTMLSIYKPRRLTAYGRRKQAEPRKSQASGTPPYDLDVSSSPGGVGTSATRKPRWIYVVGIHAIGLALLFLVLHLTGQGLPGH